MGVCSDRIKIKIQAQRRSDGTGAGEGEKKKKREGQFGRSRTGIEGRGGKSRRNMELFSLIQPWKMLDLK